MGFICSTIFFYCDAQLDALKYFQLFFGFLSTVICLRSKNQKYFLKLFYGILNLFQMYHQNTINKVKKVRKHEIASPWIPNEIKTINHFCHDLADLSCKLHLINQQENLYCFMIKIYEDSILFAYYNNFIFYKHH